MFENMPGFLAEFTQKEINTTRGKVGVEVIKNNGEIVSVSLESQNIINFPQPDNQKALLAITQKIIDLSSNAEDEETLLIRIESKKGDINKMIFTNKADRKTDLEK